MKLPTVKSEPHSNFKETISMFYGPPGVGKTTFVNGLSPRTFFISTDRGTKFMSSLTQKCHSYKTLIEIVASLEQYKSKYDIVCIDHIDDVCSLIENYVCEHLGVESLFDADFGKGWSLYKSSLHTLIQDLMKLGFTIVFICHEQIKTVRTRSIQLERVMPAMSKTSWNAVIPICDLIGYCSVRGIKTKEGKRKQIRILQTNPLEELYAKDRTGRSVGTGDYESLDPAKFLSTFGK